MANTTNVVEKYKPFALSLNIMKRTLTLLLPFLLFFVQLLAQDNAQVLASKEKEMFDAICGGDKAAAEKLFATDYITINADGVMQSREEAMNSFGKFKGSTYKLSGVRTRLYGNCAIITGRANFYIKSIPVAAVLYTETWTSHNGQWQFSGWQGTMTGAPSWYPIFFTVFVMLLLYAVLRWIRKKKTRRLNIKTV
jgi:Domain of unknown function (DUF4440)